MRRFGKVGNAQQAANGSGGGYLIDEYPNIVLAFSLRRLSSTYSGYAIMCRRGGDDAEQGFTPEQVQAGTDLLSFAAGGDDNLYVKTMYNQTNDGNNATNTDSTTQPVIVSSGTIYLLNGQPALHGDGTRFLVFTTTVSSGYTAATTFLVGCHDEYTADTRYLFGNNQSTANEWQFAKSNAKGRVAYRAQSSGTEFRGNKAEIAAGSQFIAYGNFDNTSTVNYLNNVLSAGSSSGTTNSDSSAIMARDAGGNFAWVGKFQECVHFDTDETSDWADIQTEINTFYSAF